MPNGDEEAVVDDANRELFVDVPPPNGDGDVFAPLPLNGVCDVFAPLPKGVFVLFVP